MSNNTNPLNKGGNGLLGSYIYTDGERIVIPVYAGELSNLEIEFNGSNSTSTTTSGIFNDIDYSYEVEPNNILLIGTIAPRPLETAKSLREVDDGIVKKGGLSVEDIKKYGPWEGTRILKERANMLGDITR